MTIGYTVTNAVTNTVGSALCATTAQTTTAGGLNNATTVTPNTGAASSANACVLVTPNAPAITVTKTITSAAGANPIAYLVTVTNTGGPGSYGLTDTPLFGTGLTPGVPVCVNTTVPAAGGTPVCTTGTGSNTLAATGTAIAGGASHTYTVTIGYTLTASVTSTVGSALCATTAQTTTPGGLNNAATVTPNVGNASTVNACANAPGRLTHTKVLGAGPTATATVNQYTQVYTITVNNSGGTALAYGLTDTPFFGVGTTVDGAVCSAAGTGAAACATSVTGAAPWTVAATGTSIDAGGTHTYTMTVTFTVNPALVTAVGSDCSLTTGSTTNTGLLNRATLTPAGQTAVDQEVCTPMPPNIRVTKSITSVATASPAVYLVTVTNTGGPGTYGLTDTPLFGTGLTPTGITCANTTTPAAGGTPNCTTTTGSNTLAALGTAIANGASHTYTVTIPFAVTNATTNTAGSGLCALTSVTTTPGGLNNAATVTPSAGLSSTATVNACRDVPSNPPAITVTKTIVSGNRANPVAYLITVTNTGGAGSYGLTDVPMFGAGITIDSVSCVNTTSPAAGGSPLCSGTAPHTLAAVGTAIAGGASHTYMVTIGYTVTDAVTSRVGSALCASGNPPGSGGLNNVVTVTPSTAAAINAYACVGVTPPVNIPTNNRFVLLLMVLALAAFGWQSRRRFS